MILKLGLFLLLFTITDAFPQHTLFTEILTDYVHDGHVNYGDLSKDSKLETYLEQIAATNPDSILDENARLAFWINAYNAYTLKVISDSYPIKSISELHFGGLIIGTLLGKTIWHKPLATINGEALSLNNIEHDIIRKNFKEPRIHFALVCAAKSCPPLRSEAFTGERLHEQLEDQGRTFFSQKNKNHFDEEKKVAHLSKIMDWYADDFGKNEEEVLVYVSRFLSNELMKSIQTNQQEWEIKSTDYDWSLND